MDILKAQLLKAIASGKPEDRNRFFRRLYERTFGMLYAIAKKWHRSEAEDVVSDIFAEKIFTIPLPIFKANFS